MKYYIDENKIIYGFKLDGSQDHLMIDDMKPINLEEIEAINQAKENQHKQTLEYKINEANQYLITTDWYVTRKMETGVEIPLDVLTKRAEARLLI